MRQSAALISTDTTIVIQDNKTRLYAANSGWVPKKEQALIFKSGAEALAYCLARHYFNVNLDYHNSGILIRVFDDPAQMVPTAGSAPATRRLSSARSAAELHGH